MTTSFTQIILRLPQSSPTAVAALVVLVAAPAVTLAWILMGIGPVNALLIVEPALLVVGY